MKTLFVCPEIRLDSEPSTIPFWAAILAAIVEKKGGQIAILDLNALRMNHSGKLVPSKIIADEISSEHWDIVGIGGLTTTYGRIKALAPLIRKCAPDSLFVGGGGWSTYNPTDILQLVPELDMICIGEGEETFSELYDQVASGKRNFENVNGLCLRDEENFKFTNPRSLISDLDLIPYPAYDLLELDIYFRYSSIPYSVEAYNSRRRLSTVWERGCPRGCTFCSHNGMSRIDLQNLYGDGDRKAGEKLVRISDKENDTFQLPARWPTAKYAVENVKLLYEKYNIDFYMAVDENMTSNKQWTQEYCQLYIDEGLHEVVKWGTLGDAPSVAVKPEIIKMMTDAGCTYISFGFESASNKVLNEDIQKGQTREHLQKTLEVIKREKMTPISTFMIGNMHENIDDLMETVDFWIQNNAVIDPFICTPYVGSPIFYDNQDYILGQYDPRIKLVSENKCDVDQQIIKQWKLDALDKFMKECGDAFQYTATVSQNFSVPELFALKRLMYTHDTKRMLQWAHERYDQTDLPQWKHDKKWEKYCAVCQAQKELMPQINNIN